MHGALDKCIRGLIGFRVDHIQIVIFASGTRMFLALIGIKHHQHRTALVSLIITQNIQKLVPCGINIDTGKFV